MGTYASRGLFGVQLPLWYSLLTEFLHHAATQQFHSPLIQFALFLPDLFLDARESFLERIPLIFLLLDFAANGINVTMSAASWSSSLSVFGISSP